jgi:predicted component of viral defense system (DUF524 family)
MAGRTSVDLLITDEWEYARGRLIISALPNHPAGQTIFVKDDSDVESDEIDAVRLNESTEYLYVLEFPQPLGPILTDHPEMFVADTERGDRGRLRTGLFTGAVEVQFFSDRRSLGKTSFEVQSTKLSYLTDYQWMLRDISNFCTELLMDKFAPAVGRFSVDERSDAKTLYQKFAFLRSILEGDEFQAAIRHILASPHVVWENVEDLTWPERAVRPHSRVARNLSQPGPRRIAEPAVNEYFESIPLRMLEHRATASVDNVPNRFVKWLLQEWLGLVLRLGSTLDDPQETKAFARRGRREVDAAIRTLEMILEDDLFQEVQSLATFPEANQVLQKREGYRYLYRMHLQFDSGARPYWPGLDPVYRAGRRNVAQLYEYWVYLQLGQIVARLCGQTFDAMRLVERSPDGLTLRLRAGEETMFTGTTVRFGRTLRLECWFNKSFGASNGKHEGSWTRPLRPDCSLRVEVVGQDVDAHVTWIHFDAKYRLERMDESFGEAGDDSPDRTRFRREDLLKMHAYKDAIQKSAGAYVVYPGNDGGKPFRQYHELLPGLGAFSLRPANAGDSVGSEALRQFIEDVLDHLSLQTTQYSRARYWTARAYSAASTKLGGHDAPFVERPPADVLVLLGYSKSAEHRHWIQLTNLYNLRADSGRDGAVDLRGPELSASLLVLYGPDRNDTEIYEIVEAPRIMTRQGLVALNYPEPRGNLYLCFPLKRIDSIRPSRSLSRQIIEQVRYNNNPTARVGAPVVVTWLDLCVGERA